MKVVATRADCPLGEVGVGAVVLVFEDGGLTTTGGRGGSITSFSVRTGFGASAGGKSGGAISWMRLPGSTGLIYGGNSLYPKHRFPGNH